MTDRDRLSLRGPVHTCRLQRTWYTRRCGAEACEAEERNDNYTWEFRADGSLVQRGYQNPDGSGWTASYEYNDKGQLIAVSNRSTPASEGWFQYYEYDTDGRLSRLRTRSKDGNERVAESYSYDAEGQKTKILYVDLASQQPNTAYSWGVEGTDACYSAPGAATLTTRYNGRQRPSELLFHDEAGQLLSRVLFAYDAGGNLLEEAQTRQATMLPPELLASLNPEQQKTVGVIFGVGEPLSRFHRYDEQSRRIETRWSVGPIGSDCKRMAYNEQGDLSEEISEHEEREYGIDEAGRLAEAPTRQRVSRSEARFRYSYDAHGNWLRKTVESRSGTAEDFTPASVEMRMIHYHE